MTVEGLSCQEKLKAEIGEGGNEEGIGLRDGDFRITVFSLLLFAVTTSGNLNFFSTEARRKRSRVCRSPRKDLPDDVLDGHFLDVNIGHRQIVQEGFTDRDDPVAFHLEFKVTGS